MATKLERLLENIDPSRTYDQVSARVDRAVNTFAMRRTVIGDWDQYRRILAEFCRHIEKAVLRIRSDVPVSNEFYWGQCVNHLNRAFGPTGYKAAFEMVRTGKEGGLYRILRTIADLMAENYAENEISARISHYWRHLTVDEQLAASKEYLRKYGHLLPAELTEGSAARLRANFPRVLEEHPKMVHRMRRVGR